MEDNVLKTKSFGFAIRIVRLFQYLQTVKKEYVLARQLLRCGTAIGSMIREAEHAESKADFIHKIAVAQKEANETIIGWNCWPLLIISRLTKPRVCAPMLLNS